MEESQYSSCSNFHWPWRVVIWASCRLTWTPGGKVCLYRDPLPGSIGAAGDTVWRSWARQRREPRRPVLGQWQFKQHRSAQARIQNGAAHGPHWNADITKDLRGFSRQNKIDHDSLGLFAAESALAFWKRDWRRHDTQEVPSEAHACTYHYKPQYSTSVGRGRSPGRREALRL